MKKFGSLLSIALAGFASTVSAAEIWDHTFIAKGQLRWDSFDSGSTSVDVRKTNGTSLSYNGRGGQFGGYFYTDSAQSADEFFRFFCIDLFQVAAAGPLAYEASVLPDSELARLFDIAYPNKALGDFYSGAATSFGQFGSGILSSAFQLAVWEIFYETANNFSITGGTFKSNTSANSAGTDAQKAVALADTWLDAIDAGAGSASGWTLYKFTSGSNQDYLSATYREVPVTITERSVPEPGTLAMLGLGIAALGAMRRRLR
jgi:hypothetical protein